MNKTTHALKLADIEDLQDRITKALKKAFQLGQVYWQQADSEYFSQHKKADETQAKFYELEDETSSAIRYALAEPVKQEPVAWAHPSGGYLSDKYIKEFATGMERANYNIPLYTTPIQLDNQEPVGRWNWNEAKFEWLTKFDYHKHHMTPLYAAPVDAKAIRAEALEEAAKVCEQDEFQIYETAERCAVAIRGLK